MIRGACEQFKFKIPYTFDQLKSVEITFKQKQNDGNVLIITKTLNDCIATHEKSNVVYTKLTQEETLQFATDTKAEVQWRALTTDNFPFSSLIKKITVYPTLSETILA